MTGALHPALAPLHAGGGTPGLLAAAGREAWARMERVLVVEPSRILDERILSPLTAPPAAGDVLEHVLARLASGVSEAEERVGGVDRNGSKRSGDAPHPLPADIAAHARAAARPPVRATTAKPFPIADATPHIAAVTARHPAAVPPVAAVNARDSALGDRPAIDERVIAGDWQKAAARSGADRPLNIGAEPPRPLPVTDPVRAAHGQRDARFASDFPVDDAPPARSATVASASSRTVRTPADPFETMSQAVDRSTRRDPSPIPSVRPRRPIAVAAASGSRDRQSDASTGEPAASRPNLRAVTMPEGARVGGFTGLAALGRAPAPDSSPTEVPNPPAPARPNEPTPPRAASAENPPAPDAKAVIAQLADVLRLQILAAGIDLSGRRP